MHKKHPNLNDGVLVVLKKPMTRFFYPRCPECGGLMVIRQTKIGSLRFYGCAHFPECKGLIQIDPFPTRHWYDDFQDWGDFYPYDPSCFEGNIYDHCG